MCECECVRVCVETCECKGFLILFFSLTCMHQHTHSAERIRGKIFKILRVHSARCAASTRVRVEETNKKKNNKPRFSEATGHTVVESDGVPAPWEVPYAVAHAK